MSATDSEWGALKMRKRKTRDWKT